MSGVIGGGGGGIISPDTGGGAGPGGPGSGSLGGYGLGGGGLGGGGLSYGSDTGTKTRIGGWTHTKFIETDKLNDLQKVSNIYHEYQNTFIMSGVVGGDNLELDIDFPYQLERVFLAFSDTTAKTFKVDVMGNINGTSSAHIMDYSNSNNQYYEDTNIRTFFSILPSRIIFNLNGLQYKIVDITVFMREMFRYSNY